MSRKYIYNFLIDSNTAKCFVMTSVTTSKLIIYLSPRYLLTSTVYENSNIDNFPCSHHSFCNIVMFVYFCGFLCDCRLIAPILFFTHE